jgi:ATP-dependent DNA helicase RecG
VAQRAQLRERDPAQTGVLPHLLVMTATPIPRTLAFTLYGDLELTVLDEIPPGRQPVRTQILFGEVGRRQSEEALRATVAAGRRAFVVCPVRELSAREGAVTAISRHAELSRVLGPAARVGLAHGALPARDKEAVLRAFAAGELDVLVATTLIEVGIDVPEASLMVIEEAERFGLAQLHQLRGRVGRGQVSSECLLVSGVGAPSAKATASGSVSVSASGAVERLRTLEASGDGFAIAEADLAQRGCGELFGERQSGMPRLRFADFGELGRLLEEARREAEAILAVDPSLSAAAHRGLREAIAARWAGAAVYAAEAG